MNNVSNLAKMKTSAISIWTQVQCQIISNFSRKKLSRDLNRNPNASSNSIPNNINISKKLLSVICLKSNPIPNNLKTPKSFSQWYVSNPIPRIPIPIFQETNIRDLNMNWKTSNPIPNNIKLFFKKLSEISTSTLILHQILYQIISKSSKSNR